MGIAVSRPIKWVIGIIILFIILGGIWINFDKIGDTVREITQGTSITTGQKKIEGTTTPSTAIASDVQKAYDTILTMFSEYDNTNEQLCLIKTENLDFSSNQYISFNAQAEPYRLSLQVKDSEVDRLLKTSGFLPTRTCAIAWDTKGVLGTASRVIPFVNDISGWVGATRRPAEIRSDQKGVYDHSLDNKKDFNLVFKIPTKTFKSSAWDEWPKAKPTNKDTPHFCFILFGEGTHPEKGTERGSPDELLDEPIIKRGDQKHFLREAFPPCAKKSDLWDSQKLNDEDGEVKEFKKIIETHLKNDRKECYIEYPEFTHKDNLLHVRATTDGARLMVDAKESVDLRWEEVEGWKPCLVAGEEDGEFVAENFEFKHGPDQPNVGNTYKTANFITIRDPLNLHAPDFTLEENNLDDGLASTAGKALNLVTGAEDEQLRSATGKRINLLYKADNEGHICFLPFHDGSDAELEGLPRSKIANIVKDVPKCLLPGSGTKIGGREGAKFEPNATVDLKEIHADARVMFLRFSQALYTLSEKEDFPDVAESLAKFENRELQSSIKALGDTDECMYRYKDFTGELSAGQYASGLGLLPEGYTLEWGLTNNDPFKPESQLVLKDRFGTKLLSSKEPIKAEPCIIGGKLPEALSESSSKFVAHNFLGNIFDLEDDVFCSKTGSCKPSFTRVRSVEISSQGTQSTMKIEVGEVLSRTTSVEEVNDKENNFRDYGWLYKADKDRICLFTTHDLGARGLGGGQNCEDSRAYNDEGITDRCIKNALTQKVPAGKVSICS